MPVEVQLVGSPKRWLVELERGAIRIGRSPECEVELPAADFPGVSREHAMVVLAGQELRLFDRHSGNGTFVNAQRIDEATLSAGDTVRLGADGPELLFRIVSATAVAPTAAADWTSSAAPTMRAPVAAATLPARPAGGGGAAPVGAMPTIAYTRESSPAAPARGPLASPPASPLAPPPAAGGRSAVERAVLEESLRSMRSLLLATLVVILLLGGIVLYTVQQLEAVRDDLAHMRGEAAAATARIQPAMEQDQKQLESLNGQLATQERMAEDHFVARMDKELPALMDRYMSAKAKGMGLNMPPSVH